jgi:hypothetical protein
MGLALTGPPCGVSLYTRPLRHVPSYTTRPRSESGGSLRSRASPWHLSCSRLTAASLRGDTTVTGGTRSNEHRKHVCIRVRISKPVQHTHQVRAHCFHRDDRVRTCLERRRTGTASSTGHTAVASAGVASSESWQPGDSCRRHVSHSNAHRATNDTTTV